MAEQRTPMQRSTKIAGMTALFKALISGDFLCVECLMLGLFCFESSSNPP